MLFMKVFRLNQASIIKQQLMLHARNSTCFYGAPTY